MFCKVIPLLQILLKLGHSVFPEWQPYTLHRPGSDPPQGASQQVATPGNLEHAEPKWPVRCILMTYDS